MSSGGDTFFYGGHSVHVAVAEFHDSVIKLSCLSDISDFSTLNQIYLRNVAMRQVRVADVFVDCVYNGLKSWVIVIRSSSIVLKLKS